MNHVMLFGDVLEAVDDLTLDEQEELLEVLRSRIIEQRREQLVREAHAARQEYEAGKAQPVTVDELMAEILS
jgi:hypothetical protein